jgi:hypothetical protein
MVYFEILMMVVAWGEDSRGVVSRRVKDSVDHAPEVGPGIELAAPARMQPGAFAAAFHSSRCSK